jgi:hypothetical protein
VSALTYHSPARPTRSESKALFNFLSDFRNFPKVLPADRISDFKVTDEGCSFNIQGIAALKVRFEKKTPHSEIVYHITGPAKTDLRLQVLLATNGSAHSAELHMAAHLNPFLKAMAEKPLKSLVNTIAEKLSDLDMKDYEKN